MLAVKEILVAVLGSQKFAILLCKFKDHPSVEPHPDTYYKDLFERSGSGGLDDYWRDASLKHIDLVGSKVFGWKVLDSTRDDFVTNHPGRWDKILGAIQAFQIDTSQWNGFVAVFNFDVGDGGNQNNGVLCQPGDANITFLAHETGHAMGLDHSFDTSTRKLIDWSAPGEYWDSHDVMSAMNVYGNDGSRFSPTGPLVAAPNLDRMGWLDSSRVWEPGTGNSSSSDYVDLVSLGHADRGGYVAARVGALYVEFRTKDGWDASIPRDAVLVHTLRDPNAIVLASDPANFVNDFLPGQSHTPSAVQLAVEGGTSVSVVSFNLQNKTARINVVRTARPPVVAGPGVIIGGIASGGGGLIILPSGKIIRIPPRGPLIAVLGLVAVVLLAMAVTFAVTQL